MTISLTNRQLPQVLGALKALDGVRVGKDEVKFFKWEPRVALAISHNIVTLEPMVDVISRTKRQLMNQCGLKEGEAVTPENAAKAEDFQSKLDALNEMKATVELIVLKADTLLKQGVSPGVIAQLWPILDVEEGKE